MSNIGIGIAENVVVKSILVLDEKGTFSITLDKHNPDSLSTDNIMGLLTSTSQSEAEVTLRVFPPYLNDDNGHNRLIILNDRKKFYSHLLSQYLTDDEIAEVYINAINSTGDEYKNLKTEDIISKMTNDDAFYKLHKLYVDAVATKLDELDTIDKPLRVKLPRTKKENLYFSVAVQNTVLKDNLRINADYDNNPTFESMKIAKEQSKIRFSNFEKGLDKDGKVKKDSWDRSSDVPYTGDKVDDKKVAAEKDKFMI